MKINIKLVIVSLIIVVLLYLLFFDTINENYSNYMPIEDYTLSNKLESNSNSENCKDFCDNTLDCQAYMVNNDECYYTTTEINKNNLEYKKDNKVFIRICDPKPSLYLKTVSDTDVEPTQTPYKPPFVMPNTYCNSNNYDLESCNNLSRLCTQ